MKVAVPIRVVLGVLLMVAAAAAQNAAGGDVPSEHMEMYLHTSRNAPVDDVSAAVSLDDSVCRTQITNSIVQVTGVSRGRCTVLLWSGDKRVNLLVDVVDPPVIAVSPTLRRATDFGVQGVFSTTASVTNTPTNTSLFGTTNVDWTDSISNATQLRMGGTFLNQFGAGPGERSVNVARAAIGYSSPTFRFNLFDFSLSLRGQNSSYRPGADPSPALVIRGADMRWQRGTTSYELFGGTTVPNYFLSLAHTGRVAGMITEHQFSDAFRVYNTAVYSNAPDLAGGIQAQRQQSILNTTGFEWQARKTLSIGANSGVSNRGKSATGSVDYHGPVVDAFAAVRHYDSDFPLRDLRALSDVGTTFSSGLGYALNTRIRLYGFFDHRLAGNDKSSGVLEQFSPSSSYGGHATVNFSRAHTGSFAYTANSAITSNNFTTGAIRRFDATLASTVTDSVQNTAEFSLNFDDASSTGMDQHSEWMLQDTVRWRMRPTLALTGGLSYGKTNLSLANLIRQQLSLLTPDQAALFDRDPAAFLASPDVSPELRALFDALQPSHTSISAGLEWARGRWHVAPNMRMGFNTGAAQQHSYDFGYTASFRLNQTTSLQSTLSHQYYVTNNSAAGLNRTTQFTFGLVMEFSRNPMRWISQKVQGNQISGRVFVDRSLRGVYEEEAQGLGGIKVLLDDGRSTVTDRDGQYEFLRLSDRIYHVSIPIDQFPTPVRLTTPSPATVDLRNRRSANVDFGVVNFSRVVVLAFNDYLMDGTRQPDAPLISDLKLHLIDAKGRHRILFATGGGDYEASKIDPGKYEVQVLADSVPTGYSLPADRVTVTVDPASSAIVNLPFRAMRSISGKVQFKATLPDGSSELRPLAGVELQVGEQKVTTGPDGSFLVRDLPAGEIPIRVLCCLGDVPSGVALPSGVIHLGRDPQQLENINITINNPDLLSYILPTLARK